MYLVHGRSQQPDLKVLDLIQRWDEGKDILYQNLMVYKDVKVKDTYKYMAKQN